MVIQSNQSCAVLKVVWTFLFIATQCPGQGTYHITFDGPPTVPPGTGVIVQEYFEGGVWFRPVDPIGPGDGFVRWGGGGDPRPPENGTAFLQAPLTASLAFSFSGGAVFNVVSVDLAEYSTVVPNAVAVRFVGFRSDGSMVTNNFTTDGIIDGTGPIADFQTFNLGPEFSNLTRVEIPTFGWSLDNLILSIPEPGSWALLLTGGLLLAALKFRTRGRGLTS